LKLEIGNWKFVLSYLSPVKKGQKQYVAQRDIDCFASLAMTGLSGGRIDMGMKIFRKRQKTSCKNEQLYLHQSKKNNISTYLQAGI